MRVAPARVRAEVDRPDPRREGWLLFGPEPAETDDLRVRLCDGLLATAGEGAELVRLAADAVRRDPARLSEARLAGGLFGGRPVVLVEGAGDGTAQALAATLEAPMAEAAPVVVVAGDLKGNSRLRKLFEGAPHLGALGIYASEPTRADLERWVDAAGATPLAPDGFAALESLAGALAAPEVRNLLNLLALYRNPNDLPASEEVVMACAPLTEGGDLDAVSAAVSGRRPGAALTALSRAFSRGASPVEAAAALGRWFRQVHRIAGARDPREAALTLRPRPGGPRLDALAAAGRDWRPDRAEAALAMILETERSLRGVGSPTPERAAVERLAVRLATLR